MITQLSHQRLRPGMATRKAGARPGRVATVLAAVIAGLLAPAAAATAAFATPVPIGDGGTTTLAPGQASTVQVIATGGMAGWQIALIAAGAALVAAAAAVLLDRRLAGRRGAPATTAGCARPQPNAAPA